MLLLPHPTQGEAQRADGANSSLLLYSMKAQFSIHSTITKNNHFDTLVTISVGLCAVDDLGAEYQELKMEDQHRVSISA